MAETSEGQDQSCDELRKKRRENIRNGVFLASLTGFSVLGGFGMTLAMAKKQDPTMFAQGMTPYQPGLSESGGHLAMRALARGTLYSVGGVGLFCFMVWKLSGAHNMQEFTAKVQSVLPKIPKKESTGRSDFKTIRELFEYIIDEDKKKK